jgi:hypothetical protein
MGDLPDRREEILEHAARPEVDLGVDLHAGDVAKSNREQPAPSPIEVSVLPLVRRIHGEVTTTVLLVPRRVKPPLENKRSS